MNFKLIIKSKFLLLLPVIALAVIVSTSGCNDSGVVNTSSGNCRFKCHYI